MKKILIFYASYGGGHLSAAKSINNYLNENYPDIQTELVDCMKYINADTEKAEKVLGWKAQYGIEEMCEDSWNFIKKNEE